MVDARALRFIHRACTPDLTTGVSASIGEDHGNGGWNYVYTIGAADLIIYWSKTGGNCSITGSTSMAYTSITNASYNFWVTTVPSTFTSTIHTLLKFDLTTQAFTTFSTTTSNSHLDGTYLLRYTQSEAT